jgi:hypothetical protein
MGLIHLSELQKHGPDEKLADLPLHHVGPFPTIDTPREDVEKLMMELGVNLIPVIDSKTNLLNGVLTHEAVTLSETRYYTTRLNTEIKIDHLHHQVEE